MLSPAAIMLVWRGKKTLVWCALLGTVVGGACGFGGGATLLASQEEVLRSTPELQRFEMVEDASMGAFGAQGIARTRLSSGRVIMVRLNLGPPSNDLLCGEVFEASLSLSPPSGRSLQYCWERGIAATGTVDQISRIERRDAFGWVLEVRKRALDAFGEVEGEGSAVLQALICGFRGALNNTDVYASFQVTGLAHLIAVSGAHLVIVCAFVGIILKALRVPRTCAIAVQIVFLLGYLVLSALPISALRAVIMTAVCMSSFFARRRPSSLSALGVCIAALVALSPATALSVSFALSALSTLGIVLFASLVTTWIRQLVVVIPRLVAEALALTTASSILAQPLACALFSQLPLVSLFSNVLCAPLFPFLCGGGLVSALAATFFPPLGAMLIPLMAKATEVLCAIVRWCASLPFASIPVDCSAMVAMAVSFVLAVVLWMWWPSPQVRLAGVLFSGLLSLFLGMVILAPRFSGDEIIMLNVGQGDAFVLRSGAAAVLIDTGNQDALLREALARQGIYQLDAVIITHSDDDHAGSLSSLKGLVQLDRVLVAKDALSCSCDACESLRSTAEGLGGEALGGLSQGDKIAVGSFELEVVAPRVFTEEGGNADSLCLLAKADVNNDDSFDWLALFTGDAERDQIASLLEQGFVGQVDILKVGHHGSKNALDEQTAHALSPRIALISAGKGNRYGHPTQKTLDELVSVNAQIYRTDEVGDVSCKLKEAGIVVETLG